MINTLDKNDSLVGDHRGDKKPISAKEATNTSMVAHQSWRSTGWTPLAYPAAALFQESTDKTRSHSDGNVDDPLDLNPYFPLHKDVLLAAVREILILDTSIDPTTLEVNRRRIVNETKNSQESVKVTDPSSIIVPEESNDTTENGSIDKQNLPERKLRRKRKHSESRTDLSYVNYIYGQYHIQKSMKSSDGHVEGGAKPKVEEVHGTRAAPSNIKNDSLQVQLSGEELAECLLKDLNSQNFRADGTIVEANFGNIETLTPVQETDLVEEERDSAKKRIRKVSDVDSTSLPSQSSRTVFSISPHSAIVNSSSTTIINNQDRLLPMSEEQALLFYKEHLDELLNISILVETQLRQTALHFVQNLTRNVTVTALRDFLGYKSPSIKREKIIWLIAEHLFDVSHAMFAWDKTDKDLFNGLQIDALDTKRYKKISEELFNSRALKKIGGFEPSSLLYHAVSIKYLRSAGLSWASIAKKEFGKRMFRHHKCATAKMQVGQLRRGHRGRKNRSALLPLFDDVSVTGARSRSSSIASYDEIETKDSMVTKGNANPNTEGLSGFDDASPGNAGVTKVTLTREKGRNWGILLAKEGTVCLVMRVPDRKECLPYTTTGKCSLERGDLLLSMTNERNEKVVPPTGCELSSSTWFSDAVDLFKTSDTLHLEIST